MFDLFCTKCGLIDDLCNFFCSTKRSSCVFVSPAVLPLITQCCMKLIRKKDKMINNECFVVIPVINTT